MVLVKSALYCIADGMNLNSLCGGCEGSGEILAALGPMQILNGGKVGPDDPLCRLDCMLQSVPVLYDGQSKPDNDGSA